jgi:fatty-acyl-CoA synthase
MLHIAGRVADVNALGGVTPVDLQNTLCATPSVRYAVPVTDPETNARIAAVEAWPAGVVDVEQCRTALAAHHGHDVAATLRLLPMDRIPLTEQGKPNRPAIRAAAQTTAPA